jgi:hypothetical protein
MFIEGLIFSFRMVSSYLIHHGYSATAESFTRHAGQSFNQVNSVRVQVVLKLVTGKAQLF